MESLLFCYFHVSKLPAGGPKMMILSRKKAANLSLFSKSSKWMRSQSECRKLGRKFKKMFFW